MERPKCFVQTHLEHLVCKLHKLIYGLNLSSRQWYSKCHNFVVENGFFMLDEDHYLYTKRYGPDFVFMILYVDDILITGNSLEFLTQEKACLSFQSLSILCVHIVIVC